MQRGRKENGHDDGRRKEQRVGVKDRDVPRNQCEMWVRTRGWRDVFGVGRSGGGLGTNAEAWTGYPKGHDRQDVDDRKCHTEWSVRVWNCGVWLTRCMRCAVLGRNIYFCRTERLLCEDDTRRFVEKCFQFWKGKTNLVQNPLADRWRKMHSTHETLGNDRLHGVANEKQTKRTRNNAKWRQKCRRSKTKKTKKEVHTCVCMQTGRQTKDVKEGKREENICKKEDILQWLQ